MKFNLLNKNRFSIFFGNFQIILFILKIRISDKIEGSPLSEAKADIFFFCDSLFYHVILVLFIINKI